MKKGLLTAFSIALVLAATPIVVMEIALALRAPTKSNFACKASAETDQTSENIILLGDSWTSRGRLLPGFVDGYMEAAGSPVTVCSISFPGHTVPEIVRALDVGANPSFEKLVGKAPDVLVVTAGVNDVIGHTGADQYADALVAISHLDAGKILVVEIPSIDEEAWHPTTWRSRIKHDYLLWKNDFGEDSVLDKYRARGSATGMHIIPFAPFASEADGVTLLDDGIHLTKRGDAEFGQYLGATVARLGRE